MFCNLAVRLKEYGARVGQTNGSNARLPSSTWGFDSPRLHKTSSARWMIVESFTLVQDAQQRTFQSSPNNLPIEICRKSSIFLSMVSEVSTY